MKIGNLTSYKSNLSKEELKKITKKMTKDERRELTISNIYGLMDSESHVTKKEIRKDLEKFYG